MATRIHSSVKGFTLVADVVPYNWLWSWHEEIVPARPSCCGIVWTYLAVGDMIIMSGRFFVFLFILLAVNNAMAQDATSAKFRVIVRDGAVALEKEYDLSDLSIPKEQIHRLLPKDDIPALTDPKKEPASGANWLAPDSRVIEVTIGIETLGVPLAILDHHEIVNTTIGGQSVAITYCPLCDSATVFSRSVADPKNSAQTIILEFGVSGALFNSNVLMFDRTYRGLWSQLGMRAVSGPLVGTKMKMFPITLVSLKEFVRKHPDGEIVSRDTGHDRDYQKGVYAEYFLTDHLLVPVKEFGSALPRKTLGLGIAQGEEAWFIPIAEIGESTKLETPAGPVVVRKSDAGIDVLELPADVRVAQTFYYSWSAFYPNTRVVTAPSR